MPELRPRKRKEPEAAAADAPAEPKPKKVTRKNMSKEELEERPLAKTKAPKEKKFLKRQKFEGGRLPVGSEIPDVDLLNQDGELVNVKKLSQDRPVVLFSYSRANTPGCSRQAASYNTAAEKFVPHNAVVIGISADQPAAQKKFQNKFKLGYDLLSDPQFKLLKPIGGEKTAKKVLRSQWIIRDGRLAVIDLKVSPDQSLPQSLKGLDVKPEPKADEEDEEDEEAEEDGDEEDEE